MSAVPRAYISCNTTYEHVNRACGECLENPKGLDSNEILRIPSAVDSETLQFTTWNEGPVTYVGFNIYACQMNHTSKGGLWRVPSDWRSTDSFETQRWNLQSKSSAKSGKIKDYTERTFPEQAPRTRSTSLAALVLGPAVAICCARLG